MSRVDFYVLGSGGAQARLLTACRLAEKAWRQGHTVQLRTADGRAAQDMDRLLWTFRDDSFLPHECWQPGDAIEAPVLVSHGDACCAAASLLINLAEQVPPLDALPARVAEIIADDDQGRAAGRARFRIYRDSALELVTHDL